MTFVESGSADELVIHEARTEISMIRSRCLILNLFSLDNGHKHVFTISLRESNMWSGDTSLLVPGIRDYVQFVNQPVSVL